MKGAFHIAICLGLLAGAAFKNNCSGGADRKRAAPGVRDNDLEESAERDSANLRAAAMREWYMESKDGMGGGIYTRSYREYLLDVARNERTRWASLMPGAKHANIVGGSQWPSIGPTTANSGPNGIGGTPVTGSGRITAIVPAGTPRLFVATAGGGLWRRDYGSWKPLSETIGSLACGALAMAPSNHNQLYLGLGHSFDGASVGLLTSTDSADTWSAPVTLDASMEIPAIVVDPATTTTVLAGTDQGLFRSTASGAHWRAVAINTGFATPPKIWSIAA